MPTNIEISRLSEHYTNEQAFLVRPFFLLCVQVVKWLLFQPQKLAYYRTLSDDIRQLDLRQYPEVLRKSLFLDEDNNSYLSTQTTGYRLQHAITCILITVMVIFIQIPFVGAIVGVLPYHSYISPSIMIIGVVVAWCIACAITSGENKIGFASVFSAIIVSGIIILLFLSLQNDSFRGLDAPSKSLIILATGNTLLGIMAIIGAICGFIAFVMGLIAELTINHVIKMGKWHFSTMLILILLVITYLVLIYLYVLLVN